MAARLTLGLLAAGAGLLAVTVGGAVPDRLFVVEARRRLPMVEERAVPQPDGTTATASFTVLRPAAFAKEIDPKKTAVIVCDMWDDHWCQAAAKRCDALAKKAEPVLKACRERGMTVVHAPSDCMPFYKDHPARLRMLAVATVAVPKDKEVPCPPLPIDDSDGGCDDPGPTPFRKAWTRQHAALTVDADRDYVSDSGREVYSLMKGKGLSTLIVMGVHTNMCVLNRTFAIKQMVKWNVDVLLVRDLTDSMYNPKMKPTVTHDQGTELVIEYIEAYWCPTVEAKQLK